MVGEAIAVNYYEGDTPRFLKGILIEENEDFLKVELKNYIVTIAKKQIIKTEIPKNTGRKDFEY